MQVTNSIDRNIKLFLRRKHKLYKALGQPHPHSQPTDDRQQIIALYSAILNSQNNIAQLDCFMKNQFTLPPLSLIKIMQMLWSLMTVRSGTLIAFVVYRLCRKYPSSFWKAYQFVRSHLEKQQWNKQQTNAITDLYFYGFPFSQEEFFDKIFPHFQFHIFDMLPRFIDVCSSNIFFPPKYQKLFVTKFQEWMQNQKAKIIQNQNKLRQNASVLQQKFILKQQTQKLQIKYVQQFQIYQNHLHRFSNAYMILNPSFQTTSFKLKSVFQLKKQCSTFKQQFHLSEFQQSLYLARNPKVLQVKIRKKSQMQKIQSNDYYITKVKQCNSIQQSHDLAGYFLQQMNLQTNRQKLIQIIINQCYSYNNLPYIVKIIAEISKKQSTIKDYCLIKGQKICAQMRMNPKYQRLLCEMTKFALILEDVLLDYAEKILKLQNNQVTREIQTILEHLGPMIYYRSLNTHVRINSLFQRMETIIKNKVMQFSMQHFFTLKSLHQYLQNHTREPNQVQTHEMAHLEIKDNFQFIRKTMEKLQQQNKIDQIVQYLTEGIDNEEYLNSYYYASLLKDLANRKLETKIHCKTLQIIISNIQSDNLQKSVKWSRYLGQLYNYQTISRKILVQNLQQIMLRFTDQKDLACVLKCICASLETAKIYLKQSQTNKEKKKQVIFLLIELKTKLILHREHLQLCTISEVQDILNYFHPSLLTCLNSLTDIQEFKSFASANKNLIFQHLDKIYQASLDYNNSKSSEYKTLYREKEESTQKYTQKIKYIQKQIPQQNGQNHFPQINGQQTQQSNETLKADDSIIKALVPKKMKVMGRARNDKTIKKITCSYLQIPSQP